MNIKRVQEVIVDTGLSAEQIYLLLAMDDSVDTFRQYCNNILKDKYSTLFGLLRRGYLTFKEVHQENIYNYHNLIITTKGKDLVIEVNSESKSPKVKNDVVTWIDEYRDLFKPALRSGGRPIRGDRAACIDKMVKFIKTHQYSKEQIIEATTRYMDRKSRENYTYTKCADYFIIKDGLSELSIECENLDIPEEFENNGYIESI